MDALDIPIAGAGEDTLERKCFAESISRALIEEDGSPRGVVLGLTGSWGAGKSSVLNLVDEAVQKLELETTVVVRFDPWIFSSRDDLVARFFEELLAALAEKAKTTPSLEDKAKGLGAQIWRYSKDTMVAGASFAANVFVAPGAGKMVDAAGKKLPDGQRQEAPRSLHGQREALRQALNETDLAIIVLIDELDRVENADVRAVAQLVKSVADFDSISYLIAYDRARVIEALGDGDAQRGAAYLEKIVQYEIALPPATIEDLVRMVRALLGRLSEAGLVALPADWEDSAGRLEALLTGVFSEGLIASPRLVKRWIAHFAAIEPAMRGEIDWIDLFAWSGLSVLDPDFAASIAATAVHAVYSGVNDGGVPTSTSASELDDHGRRYGWIDFGRLRSARLPRESPSVQLSRLVFESSEHRGLSDYKQRDDLCKEGLADPRRIFFPRVLALQSGFGSHPRAPTFAESRAVAEDLGKLGDALLRIAKDENAARVFSDALIWDDALSALEVEKLWLPALRHVGLLSRGDLRARLAAQALAGPVFSRALIGLLVRGAMAPDRFEALIEAEAPQGPSDVLIGVLARHGESGAPLEGLSIDVDAFVLKERQSLSAYLTRHVETGNIYAECANSDWMELIDWTPENAAAQHAWLADHATFERFLWSVLGRTTKETALGLPLDPNPLLRASRAASHLGRDWFERRTEDFARVTFDGNEASVEEKAILARAQQFLAKEIDQATP
ncbi:MAG: P-loop NTPase fold protein [Pseudomonadota bacterium]